MRILGLIGVELNRLVSRRLTLVAVLIVVALLGLLQLSVNAQIHSSSPAGVAERRAELVQAQQDWDANHEQWEAECRQSGAPEEACTSPRPSEDDWYIDETSFADIVESSVQGAAYLGGLALFVVAASFIGAEFTSGAIGNWLSFVPRRGEVYASKVIALAVGVAVIAFGLATAVIGVSVALAAFHDLPIAGLPGLFAGAGRATAAAVVLAVCGFVVALLGRHTVAALAAFLAYGVVAFVRGGLLGGQTWAQQLSPWAPEVNLAALIEGGTSYYVSGPGDEFVERRLELTQGSLYLTALALVLAVVGWLVFRRRDVS